MIGRPQRGAAGQGGGGEGGADRQGPGGYCGGRSRSEIRTRHSAGGSRAGRAQPLPSPAMHPRGQTIHLGALSGQLRHAARHLFEVVLAPLGLFYLVLTLTDLTGGLLAALGWALAALVMRVVTRSRIPAVLLLTTGLLVVRTAIGYATGSVFLYFLQPTLQNFLIAPFPRSHR